MNSSVNLLNYKFLGTPFLTMLRLWKYMDCLIPADMHMVLSFTRIDHAGTFAVIPLRYQNASYFIVKIVQMESLHKELEKFNSSRREIGIIHI